MQTSKLPKPFGLRPPQIKPLNERKINILGNSETSASSSAFSSLRLRRRSKSVADLRTLMDKPRLVPNRANPKIQQNLKTSNAKPTQKRLAEKTVDEVKPKVAKQAKIPDWDYKGRFNQLRERFALLQEEHKRQASKLVDLEDIENKYVVKQNEFKELENNFLKLSSQHTDLTKINKNLITKTSELEKRTSDYEQLQENFKEKLSENESLSKSLAIETKKNLESSCKIANLQNKLETLEHDHLSLTKHHENIKQKFESTLTENESLIQDLELEIKKNTDLSNQIIELKKDIFDGEVHRRRLHNTVQDLKGNIRVFCRIRPPINSEEEEHLQCLINYVDEKSMEIRKSRESISAINGRPNDLKGEFTLDRVFPPNSSQEEIFEDLSQLVQSALDGYDICVFAYGQTGSGKTYTMQGGENQHELGMIPRTIDLIFNSISNLHRAGWTYEVKASFLEIYNENVQDLLNPNGVQNLEIRYNEGKGTTVTNLTIQSIKSATELKKWMVVAQRNRAVAATDFNEHSSRSHAVTKIYLNGTNKEANVVYTGSINLVDLAGSESAKTSSTERLQETKSINKSLSTLGSVMLALYHKDKHIPYRNSKLTYLLQSCLGGNSKTLMVVNIAPFEECFSESINSLRFAAKVKEVKMSAKRNKANFFPPTPKHE